MKTILALFAFAAIAAAQDSYLAIGGGAGDQIGMTGTFGYAVSERDFVTVSADVSAKVVNGKRFFYTTARPGYQREIARAEPKLGTLRLLTSLDMGAQMGGNSVVGSGSVGGTITFEPKRTPNLFLYANYRGIKSPSADPKIDAIRATFTAGVGVKLTKLK